MTATAATTIDWFDDTDIEEESNQERRIVLENADMPVATYSTRIDDRVRSVDEFILIGSYQSGDADSSVCVSFRQPAERYLWQKLSRLKITRGWSRKDIWPPTWECQVKAFWLLAKILQQFELLPIAIDPSIEGGITATYLHEMLNRRLILEVYNTLEVAIVVSERQHVIYAEDIEDSRLDTAFSVFRVGSA